MAKAEVEMFRLNSSRCTNQEVARCVLRGHINLKPFSFFNKPNKYFNRFSEKRVNRSFCLFMLSQFFAGNFELPPTAAVIQGVDQSHDSQIVIEKNEQGETRTRGFDLQPVVVTDDWVGTNDSVTIQTGQGKHSAVVSEKEARGFGLKPVGTLAGDSQEIGLSAESSVDEMHRRIVSGKLESRFDACFSCSYIISKNSTRLCKS